MAGLDRIDGFTTAACVTSALARLGIAPEVKFTCWKGNEGIPAGELQPFKMVVLAADEYRRDFPCMPGVLCSYVENGGRLLVAMGRWGEENGAVRFAASTESTASTWSIMSTSST